MCVSTGPSGGRRLVDAYQQPSLSLFLPPRFVSGAIRVLTNYGVLTEGFDSPGCDTVLMARPTLSRGLYLQVTMVRWDPRSSSQRCQEGTKTIPSLCLPLT